MNAEAVARWAAAYALIAQARDKDDPELREQIYEKRVLAETMISRPVILLAPGVPRVNIIPLLPRKEFENERVASGCFHCMLGCR